MDSYYRSRSTADIASQWDIFGDSGLHLVSVAYRNPEDMTIWMNGRGRSDRLELEWEDLFTPREAPAQPDAGTPPAEDAGTDAGAPVEDAVDAGTAPTADAGTEAGARPEADAGATPETDAGSGPADSPAADSGSDTPPVLGDSGVGCRSAGGALALSGVLPLLALGLLRRRHGA